VIAIGGIHAVHLAGLHSAGAAGFAVISALAAAPDPERTARALIAAFAGSDA
jgi:thiamine monophosphate synthase